MANAKIRGTALAVAFIGIGYAAFLVWDHVSYDDDGRQAVVDQHVANVQSVGQPAGLIVGGSNGYFSLSAAQLSAQRRERWYNASIINAGFTDQNFRSFIGMLARSMDPHQVKTIVYSSPDFYYRGATLARTSSDVSISGRKPFNLRPYLSMAGHAKASARCNPQHAQRDRQRQHPLPHRHVGRMTWSTRCAAVCDIRRAPHDGQNPRRLQLNASSLSWPQSPQRRRRKPWARMPHSRKASNSSLMNRGNSAPVLASVWAMKLAACCCTRRYSVVCSGRWRS
jgi:hypothetical protein